MQRSLLLTYGYREVLNGIKNMDIKKQFPTSREEIEIELIFPNKWNPNSQSKEIFDKLKEVITKVGFVDSVLVRRIKGGVYEILDGEHRWRAATELGFKTVQCDVMDGEVDDSLARTLTLVMNNTRGEDDVIKRAQVLKEISEGQLGLLPFNREQIDEELKLLSFDFSQFADTEIVNEDEELLKKSLQTSLNLDKLLRAIHDTTTNVKLKLMLEQYFAWFKIFSQKVIESK